MKVSVCRKSHFNAAHRLFNPNWDMAKNDAVFGKCNNPNFHGHNYNVEVWVKGEINAETGFVIDLKVLKDLIRIEIEDRFDHKNLNLDCEEFKNLNPTAENICVVIWQKLRDKLSADLDLKVRLFETDRNVVEFDGN
ncbi:6-pyruvoyl trahydropterin synthase family protein [Crocinitomix catalasitica]|uniref:6-pyruvoyl trahydropterin synthase family protein n=1 Tax=Crocinitomix catalasitica TaxID=184607 RepID=UPI0004828230|nr:6-carboxytetrahydropterin synthase [Crocinitomix catalasitica]